MSLPLGQTWKKWTDDMGGLAITQLVLGAAYQVYLTRTAGPDQIMVSKDEPGKVICLTNFKARALIILPYIKEMEAVPPTVKRNKGTPLISVTIGETTRNSRLSLLRKAMNKSYGLAGASSRTMLRSAMYSGWPIIQTRARALVCESRMLILVSLDHSQRSKIRIFETQERIGMLDNSLYDCLI